eukprot:gb/GECH01011083.1/.p1 GENE.gb/GECH01011083.1/~~gb/GECH01011083.1/.p1  ORF type:complete len:636 (+),score=153.14 gb/GECH01011083.1/:1-1908(+)
MITKSNNKYQQKRTTERYEKDILAEPGVQIVVAIDASGSIDATAFETQKSIAKAIASHNLDGEMALLQFSSQAKLEVGLQPSKEFLRQLNEKPIQQFKGRTNMHAAFSEAHRVLTQASRKNTQVFLLITDGMPQRSPIDISQALQLDGIKTICVGVGDQVNMDILKRIASDGLDFYYENMELLEQDFTKLFKVTEEKTEIEMYVKNRPYSFGENWKVEFKINVNGEGRIPKGSKLKIFSNGYFASKIITIDEPISPETHSVVSGTLRARKDSFEEFEEKLSLRVKDPKGKQIGKIIELSLRMDDVIKPFIQYQSPFGKTNILTFGPAGVGKTSFISGFLSLFSPKVITNIITASSKDHVTQEILRYDISQILSNCKDINTKQVGFNLWDVWGMDLNNWDQETVDKLLGGQLPNKFRMKDVDGSESNKEVRGDLFRQMHSVLMFASAQTLHNEGLLNRLKDFASTCLERYLKPILVITQIDNLDNEEQSLKDIQNEFADNTGLSPSDIFLHENYHAHKKKNFSIDKSTFAILLEALNRASEYYALGISEEEKDTNDTPGDSGVSLMVKQGDENYEVELENRTIEELKDEIAEEMNLDPEKIESIKKNSKNGWIQIKSDKAVSRLKEDSEIHVTLKN